MSARRAEIVRENPARHREIVSRVPAADAASVDAAARRAHDAWRHWRLVPVADRCAALRRAADAVEAEHQALAVLLSRETGKVLADAHGELGFAAAVLRWYADRAPVVLADAGRDDVEGRLLLRRAPFGVVAAVTPWNAPVVLAALKVAPALVAGNTVLVKPSPLAPAVVDGWVASLASHLPAHVLGVLHGGADTTACLVSHPLVAKVAFTGGDAAGRAVGRAAGGALTPTLMELGGNDPVVLLDDAALAPADFNRLVMASFATSGQVCMAAKRLYVPRARLAEFTAAYVDAARRTLVLGDPLTAGVTLGPVATAAARDRIESLVRDARRGGAEVLPLGRVHPDADPDAGYFVTPTLVSGAGERAPVVVEEQFGPTVPVLAYDGEEEVLARANAGELGLGASVWSADEERAFAFGRRLEAGFVFVNTHNRTGLSLSVPFGGVKRSGHGREYGDEGLVEYTRTCAVYAAAAFRPGGCGAPANAYPPTSATPAG
ncbi:betaine-aldehyde dehydrogenase [Embleya scabrispora]|uniref:Betaine-aldehyde dehydrogenase n=1 Tax=Embleya scabrispora TaxID=159449 RepID=A0A1T3NSK7_9ACTN|nr:aldehyde dehydrogenase family protein [Embleya scabrispora]OPC79670.1 betaine-aldehyde dehydrogenase [Embleya scabrispora]